MKTIVILCHSCKSPATFIVGCFIRKLVGKFVGINVGGFIGEFGSIDVGRFVGKCVDADGAGVGNGGMIEDGDSKLLATVQ